MTKRDDQSLLFLIGTMVYAAASKIVTFKREKQEMVIAKLTKPQNKTRSLAMILLHGSFLGLFDFISNGLTAIQLNGSERLVILSSVYQGGPL